jgi:hypothetical protein
VRELGSAHGGLVNPGVDRQVAVLAFGAGFLAWSVLLLVVASVRRELDDRFPGGGAGPVRRRRPLRPGEPVDDVFVGLRR